MRSVADWALALLPLDTYSRWDTRQGDSGNAHEILMAQLRVWIPLATGPHAIMPDRVTGYFTLLTQRCTRKRLLRITGRWTALYNQSTAAAGTAVGRAMRRSTT